MSWILEEKPGTWKVMEYESMLNHFLEKSKTTSICQYHENQFMPETLIEVIKTHPTIYINGKTCQNNQYLPPEIFITQRKGAETFKQYEKLKEKIIEKNQLEKENKILKKIIKEKLQDRNQGTEKALKFLEETDLEKKQKKNLEKLLKT